MHAQHNISLCPSLSIFEDTRAVSRIFFSFNRYNGNKINIKFIQFFNWCFLTALCVFGAIYVFLRVQRGMFKTSQSWTGTHHRFFPSSFDTHVCAYTFVKSNETSIFSCLTKPINFHLWTWLAHPIARGVHIAYNKLMGQPLIFFEISFDQINCQTWMVAVNDECASNLIIFDYIFICFVVWIKERPTKLPIFRKIMDFVICAQYQNEMNIQSAERFDHYVV